MTVATDLFLPTSPTAPPTGSSGNGASSFGNRPQNTLENDSDRFKKHLAQKTDKATEETNKQTSGKQISNATGASDASENVNRFAPPNTDHNTYKADNGSANIQELKSDEENELVTQPDLNIHTGQNDSTHTASEIPDTTIASPTQTGQTQKDGTVGNEKTPVDTDRLQQVTFSQSDNINGITNTEKTDATPQTTNNQNKIPANNPERPVSEGEKIIKQTASEPTEITRISSGAAENEKNKTALSKPLEEQNITKQNMAEKNIIGQNAPDSNAPNQNPTDQKVAEQAVPLTDKTAPTDVRQPPEATSQQVAAVGSVVQKDAAGNNSVKNSPIKKSAKENNIAVVDEKEQTAPKDKSKTSSQNSTTDNGATKTVSAHGSTVTNSQTSLTAKTPFLTESGLNMSVTESKAGQPITLQLPPGLLSVQEVGQNSSLNNGLTAAGQIKPSMPPVTPQMITGQIRMAIAKQVSNGQNSFRISLKPAELGQVDIRMDFQAEGRITATVTVENDRTLTLLQRDQAALEKALENAGFGVGSDNLNFTLKKQQQNQEQNELTDAENNEDGENNALSGSIISQQQMKMAYSDNILDINI